MLLLAECIFCTIAELDLGHGKKVLVSTAEFLAMGCPPVAPLSIIALAYLEHSCLGAERCTLGLRRLIDDIIIDTSIISESELRAIYPSYLELNEGDKGHFLDVAYTWCGDRFVTFPFIKPFTTIPLNANSCHPWHVLRASVKNELRRLLGLCSESCFEEPWVLYWRVRFLAAGYGRGFLDRIETEVRNPVKRVHVKKVHVVNHVETWMGTNTRTAASLSKTTMRNVSQVWKVQQSLLSMALRAHEWNGDNNKHNLSKYFSSFSRYNFSTRKVRNSIPLTMTHPRGGRKASGNGKSQVNASNHSDNAISVSRAKKTDSMQRRKQTNTNQRQNGLCLMCRDFGPHLH